MKASSRVDAKTVYLLGDLGGASDPGGRLVEDREEAVAGRVDLAATEPFELAADDDVVAIEQPPILTIAKLHRLFGRADDVGKHHRREVPRGLRIAASNE